ncbi:MAG: excisionase family protein [Providencia sp.]|jgi:LPS sulfotransferase NodH|nr:excisionase family protein [Providencia sp.]
MGNVVLLNPSKWVTEDVLMMITGMRSGTIKSARKKSWAAGREYLHISPDGSPKENSECMYNHEAIINWIEKQRNSQPQ